MNASFMMGVIASTARVASGGGSATADPHFANVVLLLRFDGVAVTDESSFARTPTTNTGNSLEVDGGKYGGSLVSSSTSKLEYPVSPDFSTVQLMTLEFWIKPTAGRSAQSYFFARSGGAYMSLASNGELGVQSLIGVSSLSTTVVDGVWTHIALTRDSSNTVRLFKNGGVISSSVASQVGSGDIGFSPVGIPGRPDLPSLVGRLDEVRITKGICRYTSNFTPSAVLLGG